MNWSSIKLIWGREVRDQLRDRRTLFMIAVLPLLLYPLLGMSFFQVAQFMREYPAAVLVLGAPDPELLGDLPALIDGDRFAAELFASEDQADLVELKFIRTGPQASPDEMAQREKQRLVKSQQDLQQGRYHVVIYFPPDFAERLKRFHHRLLTFADQSQTSVEESWDIPSPTIYFNTASEKSQIAYNRVSRVLDRWTSAIGRKNLRDIKLPALAARPFSLEMTDVAGSRHRDAAMWSKVLPFVLLIWALTGAFYPAIDLCAGEKERGTLETLLSSPAERSDIVCGKLLTIMLFSVATASLNLLSMGLTGGLVIAQLNSLSVLGPNTQLNLPPLVSLVWLGLALVPVAALFSALCLALAAFARSTKEGQYYLMPLLLVTMPLMILPMAPGVDLTLGNSLIPITGVVLLLRTMLEGNYLQALPFIPPVVAVTVVCCVLAIRWAIDQFNSESALFRESERLDLALWVRHLIRDRGPTPSIAEALSCFILILLIKFFMSLSMAMPRNLGDLAQQFFIAQVIIIALPALLMTIMLTRSPFRTLLLDKRPPWLSIPVALLLACAMHPIGHSLAFLIQQLYPVSPDVASQLALISDLLSRAEHPWLPFVLLAVLPAFCEEIAFRGFILSGLRHIGHKWRAIVLSAVFFGVVHGILQQSITATLLGVVIGYLAVQTGSLVPCILFHMTYNGLGYLASRMPISDQTYLQHPHLAVFIERIDLHGQTVHVYGWPLILLGAMVAGYLLTWLHRLPYQKTSEEQLQEALEHQSAWQASP